MIKSLRTLSLTALSLLLLAGTANAGMTELTTNGDFELGDTSGWVSFPSPNSVFSITGTNPSSGSFAGNVFNPDEAAAAVVKQANLGIGLVNPGDTVYIQFDARGSLGVGGVLFAEFFSEIDGGGTSSAELLGGAPVGITDQWQTFVYTAIAGPDVSAGITLQFAAVTGAISGSFADVYLDNVSVMIDAAVVPVPAALWLFVSALGFLGWSKRRTA